MEYETNKGKEDTREEEIRRSNKLEQSYRIRDPTTILAAKTGNIQLEHIDKIAKGGAFWATRKAKKVGPCLKQRPTWNTQ